MYLLIQDFYNTSHWVTNMCSFQYCMDHLNDVHINDRSSYFTIISMTVISLEMVLSDVNEYGKVLQRSVRTPVL